MARIYQPQGSGSFPTVLDLHGGAWRRKDRLAEEPMDRAIAASGVLVVAIDLRLSEEAPYPAASVQDANYGVRWLKSRAAEWNGDPSKIGVYGSSSGGHVAQLLAMRPRDPRYNAIALPSASNLDATVAYVATRSPISDPYARFQQAERMKREGMTENSRIYFNPWETIYEGNPQQILERREPVTLVPMLIMQGALDDNVLPAAVRRRGPPQDPLGQLRAPLQHRDAGSRLDEGRLRVKELDRLLVDLHVLAVRDGRRLGRAHEVAPAPR